MKKQRLEKSKQRTKFFSDSFGYSRSLLGDKCKGQLQQNSQEVNDYLQKNSQGPLKNMDSKDSLIKLKPPSSKFDSKEPPWKEIQEIVESARSGSAPGPSSVLVYKRCPKLLKNLWSIIKINWKRNQVPLN